MAMYGGLVPVRGTTVPTLNVPMKNVVLTMRQVIANKQHAY